MIFPFKPPLLGGFPSGHFFFRAGWHDVAVDLRDVLPLLRKGGGEELGEVLLEEREDQDVPHRRQGDDEDDQKGNPMEAVAGGFFYVENWKNRRVHG